ncbi:patatin family protein [Pseudoalteromonas sp.]|uniref:patatin-like phospholipase family protein n=1 Tax=Pseudoalteromonas sp. TaxID=53249 RepID=UPI003561C034
MNSLNNVIPNVYQTDQAKLALIAEGGGQRGIFTAGVLDAWLAQQFNPFDLFIGTSAGSQNLASFLAGQKGYAQRLIRGVSRDRRFFQLGRGLMGKHIVDLDWYFEKATEANRALDFNAAQQNLAGRELLITATNVRNRKAYFLTPSNDSEHWLALLKASSALPFLYRQGVNLSPWTASFADKHEHVPRESDFYIDGGLAAPLPVREAYRRGAEKIVVIRTVDSDFATQAAWLEKIRSFVNVSGYFPKTVDYLLQHEQAYQDELDFIANPPSDVEIIQVFAEDKLQSKLLGSANHELRNDYKLGLTAGEAFLAEQAKQLNTAPYREIA